MTEDENLAARCASLVLLAICVVAVAGGIGTVLERLFDLGLPVSVLGGLPALAFWLIALATGYLSSHLETYAETGAWERPPEERT